MELQDTVGMMLSKDYKERFKAEYYQGLRRDVSLSRMLDKWTNGELDFTPTCPKELLEMQLKVMDEYLEILEERAKIEGIDL